MKIVAVIFLLLPFSHQTDVNVLNNSSPNITSTGSASVESTNTTDDPADPIQIVPPPSKDDLMKSHFQASHRRTARNGQFYFVDPYEMDPSFEKNTADEYFTPRGKDGYNSDYDKWKTSLSSPTNEDYTYNDVANEPINPSAYFTVTPSPEFYYENKVMTEANWNLMSTVESSLGAKGFPTTHVIPNYEEHKNESDFQTARPVSPASVLKHSITKAVQNITLLRNQLVTKLPSRISQINAYEIETIPAVSIPVSNLGPVNFLIDKVAPGVEYTFLPTPHAPITSQLGNIQSAKVNTSNPGSHPMFNTTRLPKNVIPFLNVLQPPTENPLFLNLSTTEKVQPPVAERNRTAYVETTGNSPLLEFTEMTPTSKMPKDKDAEFDLALSNEEGPDSAQNENLISSNSVGGYPLSTYYGDQNAAKTSNIKVPKIIPFLSEDGIGKLQKDEDKSSANSAIKKTPNEHYTNYSPQHVISYVQQPITDSKKVLPKPLYKGQGEFYQNWPYNSLLSQNYQFPGEFEYAYGPLPFRTSDEAGSGTVGASIVMDESVGIIPSTSYNLPNFFDLYIPPESTLPRTTGRPSRNAASDLITGASSLPFLLSRQSAAEENEQTERKGKTKKIVSQFGRKIIPNMNELAKYEFNYIVRDDQGAAYSHQEKRKGNSTHGSYNVILPDGLKQIVDYEANNAGFYPRIRYERNKNLMHDHPNFSPKKMNPRRSDLRVEPRFRQD